MRNILTIAKKEYRSYLNQPAGYVTLIVYLALTFWLFFRTALVNNEASMRPLFENLPWVMMFFVPAVTMRALAAETHDGTIETLLTFSVTDRQVVLGKFLGSFVIVGAAILLTLAATAGIAFAGHLDPGTVAAQYLGALLLGAALTAIGIFSSSVTKNQTISYILTVIVAFILLIIGTDLVAISLPFPLNDFARLTSLMTGYDYMDRGVINSRDLVYFIIVTLSFITAAAYFTARPRYPERSRATEKLRLRIISTLGVAVLIVMAASLAPVRLDLTAGKLYSLSPATAGILGSVKKPVKITFYASSELPPEVGLTYRDIRDLLKDYDQAGPRIQLAIKKTDTDEAKKEAQQAGLQVIEFNVLRKDEYQVKNGFLGIVIEQGQKKEIVPISKSLDDLEYRLTSLILKMDRGKKKTIAFVSGHGEKQMLDYSDLQGQLAQEYSVRTLDMTRDGPDKTMAAVVIAGPTQNINRTDQAKLLNYVREGGSLFALIDTLEVQDTARKVVPVKHNFNTLLKEFGVTVESKLLYDWQSHDTASLDSNGSSYYVDYPLWLRALPVENAPIAGNVPSVMLPWAHPLNIIDKGRAKPVLATSNGAGFQEDKFDIEAESKLMLKTNLQSYPVATYGKYGAGRVVVVGDSGFLTNLFLNSMPENFNFALNSLDWLAQDSLLTTIRAKSVAVDQLVFSSDAARDLMRYSILLGVPAAVAGFGFVRLWRRRRRFNRPILRWKTDPSSGSTASRSKRRFNS